MSCTVKERLIDTIKEEIKGKATSYTFEKERVFIPVSNVTKDKITSKNNAYKTGERIVNKLNLQYKPFTKSDIVSLDTTPKEGVYINIHPDTKVVAAYEYKELQEESGYYDKQVGQTTLFQKSNTSNKKPVNKFYLLGDSLNVKSFLEDILKDEKWTIKHSQLAKMAKVFLDNLHKNKTINVKFVDKLEEIAEQSYTSGTNSILLDSESFEVSEDRFIQSFIHEIGHSFTINALVNPKTEEDEKFKKEIFAIFQEAKKLKGNSTSYGWHETEVEGKNYPLEFISEFWANPKFREEIRNLKSSFIDRILKAIGNLFGIKIQEEDLFYRTEKVLSDYLTNVKKVTTIGNLPITINQKAENWNDNQGSAFEQQQRFFKRRIADLNKKLDKLAKYSKEWLELKKSINELELNVKEAAVKQDENLYFELGKEILQDVANFIEELKVGTRNPTDRYLDYTLEVLSTWSDFPGLETEVNRLRKEVFPFVEESNKEKVNQYATEGREITKEDIDKQDEDIRKLFNLGSRFLGSLSDSASYLGRTIGALIKEAQNTASSESKKTRDVIQTEVDELYQWAIRNGVKPINMYDVFIQVDGTNSKLTQPHFADGRVNPNYEKIQSSPELSRFYKFYQDTMEVQQIDFPFKPGKNWIPNIKATSIKRTLQDINPVKERTLKPGSITEEYLPDDVPIKYLKNIPANEKSTDLGNSLLAFTRHSNEFKQLSDVLPQIRLLQEGIKYKLVNGTLTDRKYKKGSNPNLSVNGEDSDLYKMTEDVIKMQVLGQMKKEEGKVVINDTSDNDGNIKQTYFDTTSLIDNLLKWNSLLRVGLSPINSTINVLVGDSQNILESIGGRFFGFKDLTTATQIFFKQTLHKDSTLNTILETAGVLQEMEDYEAISTSVGAKTLTKEKLQEYVYSLQKAGEKYLQSRTLLAMMLKEEYLTSSGNVTSKWNNLSTHDKNKFIDKVQRVNIMTHGRYSAREASTLQQGVVFRMVSQFRKWVFSGIENRVAGKSYDNRLGMEFEGRYVTYLSLIKELAKYKGQLEGGRKLTELEVYNLRKGLTEIVLILAMIAMYGLVGGDDEEAKANRKNPVFKTALTLLNRVSGDLAFFYSAESLTQLAGNAIPMLKLVNDVRVIPGMLVDGLLGKDMNYKTGSRKDRNKLVTKFEQITPGLKEIDTFSRLANKQSLEELRPK